MVTVKHHHLSSADLAIGAPSVDTADLTERRRVERLFPKDTRERDCYRYLLEQMERSPDRPPTVKGEFEEECRRRYQVTLNSFEYCWREAIKVSGAFWDQPGRRSR
jgi:hypothetical protein